MNWEALGAIAELLGAIGVIATLSLPFSTSSDACCCRRAPCPPAPKTNISVRFVTEQEKLPPCDITSSFRASRGFHVVPV